MLTREGNRVGALMYGSDVDTRLPARGGRAQVLQLLHRLQHRPPPRQASGTRLHELLEAAAHQLKRRATVFVVSDFISEPGWDRPLAQLSRRHEVVAVRVLDPLEQDLPDLGLVPMRDAETGEFLMVDTHDARFRQRYAQLVQAQDERFIEALGHAGVDALELRTDDDLLDALVRFCALRKRRVQSQASAKAPSDRAPALRAVPP